MIYMYLYIYIFLKLESRWQHLPLHPSLSVYVFFNIDYRPLSVRSADCSKQAQRA